MKNAFNNFAPFRALFTGASSDDFSVTPEGGTMNRRSGEPVKLVVRYTPTAAGQARKRGREGGRG